MPPETLMLPCQARSVSLRAESYDADAGTVDIVWTTGAAVQRFSYRDGAYVESLDVTPAAVRLGRLNAGAPFLNTHSSYELSDIIGSVVPGTARLQGGQGVASIKLSSDPAHAGIVGNIRDGVIRNVSVGYLVHQVVKTEGDDGTLPQWRVTDWEPIEISAVPIPADPGAQMRSGQPAAALLHPCLVTAEARSPASPASPEALAARAAATKEAAMPPENTAQAVETAVALTETRAAPAAAAVVAPAAVASATTDAAVSAAQIARVQGILGVSRKLRIAQDVTDKAIADNTSLDAFRALAIDAASEAQERAAPAGSNFNAGAAERDHRSYAEPKVDLPKGTNATHLMMALAATRGSRTEAAAFVSHHYGRSADVVARALSTSLGSAGGFLLPTEMSTEVIELLRPASVVMALDPIIMPMPSGNMSIPRLAGGANAGYVGENLPTQGSQENFGMVQLSAKKLTALVPISNDMIKFPSISTDTIVRDDMVASIATRADLAFMRGVGSQFSPRGLRSFASAVSLGGANVLAANPVVNLVNITTDCGRMELALLNANVKMKKPGWIMSPRTMVFLMNIRDGLGNQIYLGEMTQGRFRGKPFKTSTQVPINLAGTDSSSNPTTDASELYLADFAEVIIGEAYGLEIETFAGGAYIDSNGVMQSGISNDQTVMRAIVQHDMAMRQEAAVVLLTNVRWF